MRGLARATDPSKMSREEQALDSTLRRASQRGPTEQEAARIAAIARERGWVEEGSVRGALLVGADATRRALPAAPHRGALLREALRPQL